MYSHEDRMKAVTLYIKYDFSAAGTVRELGYRTVRCWWDGIRSIRKQGNYIGSIRSNPDTPPNKCRLPWIITLITDAVSAER
ncbi:MAG: hypothetical protein GX971_10110 [Firmicutes bacterium]|nr:hypothetical protein [Bacillota bacterium]